MGNWDVSCPVKCPATFFSVSCFVVPAWSDSVKDNGLNSNCVCACLKCYMLTGVVQVLLFGSEHYFVCLPSVL